jgi:hypothetical protein
METLFHIWIVKITTKLSTRQEKLHIGVRVRFLQNPDLSAKRNDGAEKGVATDGSQQDVQNEVQMVRARSDRTTAGWQ